jgi:hypothetical protein
MVGISWASTKAIKVSGFQRLAAWDYARSAIAEQNQHASALGFETGERLMDRFSAAEYVGNDIGAVQPGKHVLAVADAAVNEGYVIDRIERRQESVTGQCADLGFNRKLAGALDQLVAGRKLRRKVGMGGGTCGRLRHSLCRAGRGGRSRCYRWSQRGRGG